MDKRNISGIDIGNLFMSQKRLVRNAIFSTACFMRLKPHNIQRIYIIMQPLVD